ncbi:MAG: pentapeptide repeat-containing protein [Moorea sp. SIO3G5]|nr:pentapeptide repeat-containing protein [Moorena sp. SIO3G5]
MVESISTNNNNQPNNTPEHEDINNDDITEPELPKQESIQRYQEVIYQFFLKGVNGNYPETVLLDFKQLFISCEMTANLEVNKALLEIILHNDYHVFANTFKRACYIVINNWYSQRNLNYITKLIKSLETIQNQTKNSFSQLVNRQRNWLVSFINSDDYNQLKLFNEINSNAKRDYWSSRYASYLLVPQYLDHKNPIEQRKIAIDIAKQLKDKFTFDLARYTVHYNSPVLKPEDTYNPTNIGNEVIDIIKKIESKQLWSNYNYQARIFVKQIKNLNYRDFKQSLKKYLLIYVHNHKSLAIVNSKISQKIDQLYIDYNQSTITLDLILRTCRRLVELFTTEDSQEPSPLFILLTTQEDPLTLVSILLKIVLICKYVKAHLDVCIAKLIRYYENSPEQECKWFINFLEVFNIVSEIYTQNIQYNLIKIEDTQPDNPRVISSDSYRVFPQLKGSDLRGTNLSGADLRNTKLRAADLRGANLSGANLSQADLSLAKLSGANLSGANLSGVKLITADLNSADLSSTNLSGADLRRTNLQQANLSNASLNESNLLHADLQNADLSDANLSGASLQNAKLSGVNLSGANLNRADLRHTKLNHANLSGANLKQANLNNANLCQANLCQAKLNHSNLNHVNLDGANLTQAHLRGASLNYASLRKTNLSYAQLSHAQLSYGDLSGSELSYAQLRHVDLTNADLSQTNLMDTNLFGSNLHKANVQGAKFWYNAVLPDQIKPELEQRGAIFIVNG